VGAEVREAVDHVEFKPDWVGPDNNCKLKAHYPEERNLAWIDLVTSGYEAPKPTRSLRDVAKAYGDEDEMRLRLEIAEDALWALPTTLEALQKQVAKDQGNAILQEVIKLREAQQLTKQGAPGFEAGVPNAGLNGPGEQRQAGGGGNGIGVPGNADSQLGGQINAGKQRVCRWPRAPRSWRPARGGRVMPQSAGSFTDQLSERFAANFQTVKDHLVAQAGPPPASKRLSQPQEDALWAYADPKVDRDQLAQQIMTTGLPPEMLHPDSPAALDIVKEHPDMVQALAQPTNDAEMADQFARMCQWPFRWGMLKDITDHKEQVQRANTLDRRFQERHARAAPGHAGRTAQGDSPPLTVRERPEPRVSPGRTHPGRGCLLPRCPRWEQADHADEYRVPRIHAESRR
jgi:hypothetical protein